MPKNQDDMDLTEVLGVPDEEYEVGETEEGESEDYLASKDPELVDLLMDAVDDSLDLKQRAEALCKAMEMNRAAPVAEPVEDEMALAGAFGG